MTKEEKYIRDKNFILEHVFMYGQINNIQNVETLKICRQLVYEGVFREPKLKSFDING